MIGLIHCFKIPILGVIFLFEVGNIPGLENHFTVKKVLLLKYKSYSQIASLSALIACNATNWSESAATSFLHKLHHLLMVHTLGVSTLWKYNEVQHKRGIFNNLHIRNTII